MASLESKTAEWARSEEGPDDYDRDLQKWARIGFAAGYRLALADMRRNAERLDTGDWAKVAELADELGK